jgi:hypothetical protein
VFGAAQSRLGRGMQNRGDLCENELHPVFSLARARICRLARGIKANSIRPDCIEEKFSCAARRTRDVVRRFPLRFLPAARGPQSRYQTCRPCGILGLLLFGMKEGRRHKSQPAINSIRHGKPAPAQHRSQDSSLRCSQLFFELACSDFARAMGIEYKDDSVRQLSQQSKFT